MAVAPNVEIKLDAVQDQGFFTFYNGLPEKPSTTIRFFDRGDYYTTHGDDATFTAKEVFNNLGVVKYFGKEPNRLASTALNRVNFESFIRELLLVKQYRVEVYKNKAAGTKNYNWALGTKASPGNVTSFEDILFGDSAMSAAVGVLAVKVAGSGSDLTVGVAYADATLQKLIVSEFADNEQFANLEALVVQLGPRECLVATGEVSQEVSHLRRLVERSGLLLTERKKSDFSAKDVVQDLNRLLKVRKGEAANAAALPETSKQHAMCALAACIKYLELLNDSECFGQFSLTTFDLSQYVKLDSAGVKALNLFPEPGINTGARCTSILKLLDRCRTAPGQRLLAQWIKQPLVDVNRVEERLNLVEALIEDAELRHTLHEDLLRRLPDFQKLAKRFQRRKSSLQDCYRVYQALEKVPSLIDMLDKHSGQHKPTVATVFVSPLTELMMDFKKFQEMVETTIDLEQVDSHEFLVKASFDEELQALRDKMSELERDMKTQLNKAARDIGLEPNKSIKLENCPLYGYVFRITRKDEKLLRKASGYQQVEANKSVGVRFRTSTLRQLNDDWQEARRCYDNQQQGVVDEVMGIAAGYVEPMLLLNDVVARLDVTVSLAVACVSAPASYVRPKILAKGSGVLKLKEARHPLLEVQDDVSYIANDVTFDKDGHMFHIITGPNMGGKSTYIRAVGCIVLLAQMGCFVPCDEAVVTVVDSIWARIGASDNQMKGVSTFMSEMLETATILKSASANSLIIIDELGRGTSTSDGFGLAWGISEYIAKNIGGYCLFATHFHELTALADVLPTVNNLHVTALTSSNTLTLLYRVKPGACDQSFGIHVAEFAHLPKHVIEFAKEKAREFEDCKGVTIGGGDTGDNDEPAVKRRKQDKEEGMRLISDCLSHIKALPSSLGATDIKQELARLKGELLARNNTFVANLLSSQA